MILMIFIYLFAVLFVEAQHLGEKDVFVSDGVRLGGSGRAGGSMLGIGSKIHPNDREDLGFAFLRPGSLR